MDLTTVVMPGAQSLVTAILTDGWGQARTAIAKLWAGRRATPGTSAYADSQAEPGAAAIERADHELEAARRQALELAGSGPDAERADRMRLFWAGYLAGQLAARPELADVLAQLPALLSTGAPASQTTNVHANNLSGRVDGPVVQTADIHGGFTFGR